MKGCLPPFIRLLTPFMPPFISHASELPFIRLLTRPHT